MDHADGLRGQAHTEACGTFCAAAPVHIFSAVDMPDKESRANPSTQEIAATGENTIKMWVIESYIGGLRRFSADPNELASVGSGWSA